MAGDFEFGMNMHDEPEVEKRKEEEEPQSDPEDMDFLPAGEDDTQNYTATSITDLLF